MFHKIVIFLRCDVKNRIYCKCIIFSLPPNPSERKISAGGLDLWWVNARSVEWVFRLILSMQYEDKFSPSGVK